MPISTGCCLFIYIFAVLSSLFFFFSQSSLSNSFIQTRDKFQISDYEATGVLSGEFVLMGLNKPCVRFAAYQ